MSKFFASMLLAATSVFAQYKAEPAGAPPSEVAPSVAELLQKQGTKISADGGKVYCEVWLRSALPAAGTPNKEEAVTLQEIPHGTLMGVLRVPEKMMDRRSGSIKPGVYTLRYSFYPVNGAHQGVAPQRDFLILSRAADDKDGKAAPDFASLMKQGAQASGQPHPNVLSLWKQDSEFQPGFTKMGEKDWVLQQKIGAAPIALILVGQAES